MNKEDDFMSDYDNAIFRLATAQEAEPEDWTGFCIAGAAASPKKPILQRARRFSDVTATPKNVTASGNAGKCWKPPTGSRSTGRKWNG